MKSKKRNLNYRIKIKKLIEQIWIRNVIKSIATDSKKSILRDHNTKAGNSRKSS